MNAKAELIPAGQPSTDVAVRAREAHERLQERMKGARYDWAELGIALAEARRMIDAGEIEVEGKTGDKKFGAWMEANGLGEYTRQQRSYLVQMGKILTDDGGRHLTLLEEITNDGPARWVRAFKERYPEQHDALFSRGKGIPHREPAEVAEQRRTMAAMNAQAKDAIFHCKGLMGAQRRDVATELFDGDLRAVAEWIRVTFHRKYPDLIEILSEQIEDHRKLNEDFNVKFSFKGGAK